ncbi:hypothetical protein EDD76_11710 [Kineothrix alysoides]|uniref:Uncharacterized protein n=1 Tax=Kineothrix alysoides TaxID=1469948 RepID=A0A4R1QRI5_9FIRM|nr:hypothetical protein EDD76_11710 [Kineothrix alysoides]
MAVFSQKDFLIVRFEKKKYGGAVRINIEDK